MTQHEMNASATGAKAGTLKYSIDEIREAWVKAAEKEWRKIVRDEDQSPRIKAYFRQCGWGFWVDDEDGYRNDAKHAWCGIFQGYCGLSIGKVLDGAVYLHPEIALHCLPSTARIVSRAKWRAAGVQMPRIFKPMGAEYVDEDGDLGDGTTVLRRGVVATVTARDYGDHRNEIGGHFVLITKYDPVAEVVETIEGNARGGLADQTHGEGVVIRRRPTEQIRRVIHFDRRHFEYVGTE